MMKTSADENSSRGAQELEPPVLDPDPQHTLFVKSMARDLQEANTRAKDCGVQLPRFQFCCATTNEGQEKTKLKEMDWPTDGNRTCTWQHVSVMSFG